jgi:hypothetical protein
MTNAIRINIEFDRYNASTIAGKSMFQCVGHEFLRYEANANFLMSLQLDIGHIQ